MLRIKNLKLPVDHSEEDIKNSIIRKLRIKKAVQISFRIIKRSLDARKKDNLLYVYSVEVDTAEEKSILLNIQKYKDVDRVTESGSEEIRHAPANLKFRPVIIGCGPCGLFAALMLSGAGYNPVIIERGRKVRERSADTFRFWKDGIFDPESNVQFGEGGAGTFSDGKLNTQIRDPKNYKAKVLNELVRAGAPSEIEYAAKPHVGTFRLVKVVENLRNKISASGGEFLFGKKVTDIVSDDGEITGVRLEDDTLIEGTHFIFAIGHSARDTFRMLHKRGVRFEPKPFSVGFRIEHPQSVINEAVLGDKGGGPLGAAEYKLVHHCSNGRSVYSFCMCPGGRVVAAASEEGRVVTNGMSQYTRDEQNANSALVVGVKPDDFSEGELGGMEFQDMLEKNAFILGGSDYSAPAQLVGDFLNGVASSRAGTVTPTYMPGVRYTDLSSALPEYVISALREAIAAFDKQIKGFSMHDAVLTGVETRTSSPVRIVRGDDMQSVTLKGFYPGGEGAGYAGGIMSAAIDGIKIAESVAMDIAGRHD
ncbi:MAG: hypothetical protein JXN63_02080 [Candidatus Delongbacteria bacterium]|nr:hypothetical protein [Candidatus Delongbacteria bacterium]